ncbi:hypothetical protein KY285_025430 [Solanum tuberosum]|nr:hypothetical protein KY285_025430 [Solanum tuberosum]
MRAEKRLYQMRKRSERILNDSEEVLIAKVGPNFGFDETDPVDNKLESKIIGDEHVYCSFDAYSVETDSNDETRRDNRRRLREIVMNLLSEVEHRMYARHILDN